MKVKTSKISYTCLLMIIKHSQSNIYVVFEVTHVFMAVRTTIFFYSNQKKSKSKPSVIVPA